MFGFDCVLWCAEDSAPVVVGDVSVSPSSGVFVGTQLSCVFVVADADGDVFNSTVEWFDGGASIPGARGRNFTVTAAQAHSVNVTCEVTPANVLTGVAARSASVSVGRQELRELFCASDCFFFFFFFSSARWFLFGCWLPVVARGSQAVIFNFDFLLTQGTRLRWWTRWWW